MPRKDKKMVVWRVASKVSLTVLGLADMMVLHLVVVWVALMAEMLDKT